jgi:hypothetical protein
MGTHVLKLAPVLLLGLFMRLWDRRRPNLDYGPPQEQQNQVDKLNEGKGREEKGALVSNFR